MTVLLGRLAGTEAEIATITERAMNGELEYAESLRSRVALLEGLPLAEVDQAFEAVRLRPGAADVLRALSTAGVATAILTGGFERGVQAALEREGVAVDRVVANRLIDTDGALTGVVEGPLVEGTKDDILTAVADEMGVPMADTIAIGDGANDRPMLEVAGLAIGYEPKAVIADVVDESVALMPALARLLRRRGVVPE